MIEGHDILCFAPGPWDDVWRNRHHIMTRLARANRVLYIEPWPYLHPTLRQWREGQLHLVDLRSWGLRQVGESLYVYRPPLWAPRAASFALAAATKAVYMALLKGVLGKLRFRRSILWLFLPDMEVFVGQFGEKLVIYHIVDEYSGYTGVSDAWRPVMQRLEQQLAARADLVFVTSPTLLESKRALNECVFLVPNAVDYDAFVAALKGASVPPSEVAALPRPIAGYVGAINDKVDLALLSQVASRCPDWTFLLVGPVTISDDEGQCALQRLQEQANVFCLGRRGVEQVPLYIASCDVCLLPYRINEWTRNIDSLKLYEYLACGKPVVATDVPAAQRFAEVVSIASDEAQFVLHIGRALQEDTPAQQAQRRAVAAQNTWDQRVGTLSAAIEARLQAEKSSVYGRRV